MKDMGLSRARRTLFFILSYLSDEEEEEEEDVERRGELAMADDLLRRSPFIFT